MGWWNQTPSGASLVPADTGLVWGDGPADLLDAALDEIAEEFRAAWNRDPTKEELRAGLEFSLGGRDE